MCWRRVICKKFWHEWFGKPHPHISNLTVHIHIVENYEYATTCEFASKWQYFSCSHFVKWREKLMFTLYNDFFWKICQIVIKCEQEFFSTLYKVWTWQIVLQFRYYSRFLQSRFLSLKSCVNISLVVSIWFDLIWYW